MKNWKKIRLAAVVLSTLAVLSVAVLAYINQLSHTTESSVLAFMKELSGHDQQNIQSELERSWEEIAAIYSRT